MQEKWWSGLANRQEGRSLANNIARLGAVRCGAAESGAMSGAASRSRSHNLQACQLHDWRGH